MAVQIIGVVLLVSASLLICWQYSPPAKNLKRKNHVQAQKRIEPVAVSDWRTPESELTQNSYPTQGDWRFPYEFDNRTEVARRRANGEAIDPIWAKLRWVDVSPKKDKS